jgi:5-methyltetrahydrofolate--homocysteine methyltransferase
MAIASGLTSAITSPLHEEVRFAIWAADVMNGNDDNCADWIARNSESGEAAQTGRRGGREGRRRAASA